VRSGEVAQRQDTPISSNDLSSPAAEIVGLYKQRRAIELIFHSVRQIPKILPFSRHLSHNAVDVQIDVA
jgi:hypothetical protein